MDGNGRWATGRGRPRREGHEAGAVAVQAVVEAAPALGITLLTLYAFSSDNWRRPRREIGALFALLRRYLDAEHERLRTEDIRLSVIGRRDRLPRSLRDAVERAERATARAMTMHLRIAIDYSGRDALLAAARAATGDLTRESFAALLGAAQHGGVARDVDLLIRTGGEHRLSDFMLWESAYAELWFTSQPWPEFTPELLGRALSDFSGRERRFGALQRVAAAGWPTQNGSRRSPTESSGGNDGRVIARTYA